MAIIDVLIRLDAEVDAIEIVKKLEEFFDDEGLGISEGNTGEPQAYQIIEIRNDSGAVVWSAKCDNCSPALFQEIQRGEYPRPTITYIQ